MAVRAGQEEDRAIRKEAVFLDGKLKAPNISPVRTPPPAAAWRGANVRRSGR